MSAREPIAGSAVDVEIGYARLTLPTTQWGQRPMNTFQNAAIP